MLSRRCNPGLATVLAFLLVFLTRPVAAQEAPGTSSAPVFTPDARSIDRIRDALDREPALRLPDDSLRFYLETVSRPRTWQEYMAGARDPFAITTIAPPSDRPGSPLLGGGGIDLLAIFRRANQARRDREARQIRERINRELRALEDARQ